VAILALGVAATVGAIVAYNAQQDAQDSAALAEERRLEAESLADSEREARAEAESQRSLAEQEATRAEENAAEAVRAAQEARARELAAAALVSLDDDPERSILLAVEAIQSTGDVGGQVLREPITALRQALAASRVVARIPGGHEFVEFSPDGSLMATGFGVDVAIWDANTYQQIRILPSPEGRRVWHASFSPDGDHLAVTFESNESFGALAVVWDVYSGETVRLFEGPAEVQPRVVFNSDGTHLAIESVGGVLVFDVASGSEQYRIEYVEGHYASGPSFSPDGRLLATTDRSTDPEVPSRVVLHDPWSGVELDWFDAGDSNPHSTAFDPTGRFLAAISQTPAEVLVWDVSQLELVASIPLAGAQVALEWSLDGRIVAVSGNEGIPRLFDVDTGEEVLALVGHDSIVWSLAFSPDGRQLAGAGLGVGLDTLVWDISAAGIGEVINLETPYSSFLLKNVRYTADGKSILVSTVPGSDGTLARIDAETGEVLVALSDQLGNWPATALVDIDAGLVGSLNADGTAMLRDLETFTPIVSLPEGFFALAVTNDGTRVLMSSLDFTEAMVAEVGSWETVMKLEPSPVCFGDFNPAGDLLSAYNCQAGGHNWLIDVERKSIVARFRAPETDDDPPEWIPAQFSPDGSFLAMRDGSGRFGLLDISVLDSGGTLEKAWVFNIDAHDGVIPDNVVFSPDESLAATWGLVDRHLRVWRTEDGQLAADLGETTATFPGFDFHPNGRHFLVEGANGTLRVYTLDTAELINIARSRITRGFTDDECATYHLDPCPDLETIKGG
jgi:WD40 repeat protein